MSRKKDEKSNKGKTYSVEECNFIAFSLIWGICSPERLATKLGRTSANAIERMFDRICRDASDYPDRRGEYKLWPIISSVGLKYINAFAWQFIVEQHIVRKKNLENISLKTGMDLGVMVEEIENRTNRKYEDGLLS